MILEQPTTRQFITLLIAVVIVYFMGYWRGRHDERDK